MNINWKILLPVLVFAFTFIRCREDINSISFSSSEINEPVKITSRNNYIFIINAKDLTNEITDYSELGSNRTRVFVSVEDYKSGFIRILISNPDKRIVYSNVFSGNDSGNIRTINGDVPESIQMKFENFSAKLKIQLTAI